MSAILCRDSSGSTSAATQPEPLTRYPITPTTRQKCCQTIIVSQLKRIRFCEDAASDRLKGRRHIPHAVYQSCRRIRDFRTSLGETAADFPSSYQGASTTVRACPRTTSFRNDFIRSPALPSVANCVFPSDGNAELRIHLTRSEVTFDA